MQANPNLSSYSAVLADKYGAVGTPEREAFDNRARTYYMGLLLQTARKQEHITQVELAKRTGTTKSYISRVENGVIDPTISSFIKIINALGLKFELSRALA